MGKGTLLDQSKDLPNNAIKTRFVFPHHSMTYQGRMYYLQSINSIGKGGQKGKGMRESSSKTSPMTNGISIASHHWRDNKKAHSQALSALALQYINKIILITDIHPLSSMKLSHLINLFIPLVLQLYFLITAARTSLQGCLSYCSKFNSSKYKNCS